MTSTAENAAARPDERKKVLALSAGVILLFGLGDYFAVGRFDPVLLAIRVVWAALAAVVGHSIGRVKASTEHTLFMALAIASGAFFSWIAWQTGGYSSPLFHWILAMPLTVAVVVQDHPRATAAASIATLAGGLTILALGGQPLTVQASWLVQAVGMSLLAFYASVVYRRFRSHSQRLMGAEIAALEQTRLYDLERMARSRAEAAAQAREEFISIASHELKNPLTPLKLRLENAIRLLQRSPDPPARVLEQLFIATRQVDRINHLIDDLLDVSRLSGGRMRLDLEEVDLLALVHEVTERFAEQCADKGCPVEVVVGDLEAGYWDPRRIEQVYTNLLSNALKYGGNKPIEVRIERVGALVRLSVRDGGPGIGPADCERIFQKFERASSPRDPPGLGLGLFISREIVELHGGTLTVESEPGKGATFIMALPRSAPPQPPGEDISLS